MLSMFKAKPEDKLKKHVNDVKLVFNANGVGHIPFYIAGGSVYSILNGVDSYRDVDIFFYNSEDATRVITALKDNYARLNPVRNDKIDICSIAPFETKNALTFYRDVWQNSFKLDIDTTFQFITKYTGSVNFMLSTFDLSASCFACTSEYEIIKGAELTADIKINFVNFGSDTLNRYQRYILEKDCNDKDNVEYFKILNHLVKNFYNTIAGSMYSDPETGKVTGVRVLRGHLSNTGDHPKYIYNAICDKFKKEELITAFKELNFDFEIDEIKVTPEYVVFYSETNGITNDEDDFLDFVSLMPKRKFDDDTLKLAYATYPEYFI